MKYCAPVLWAVLTILIALPSSKALVPHHISGLKNTPAKNAQRNVMLMRSDTNTQLTTRSNFLKGALGTASVLAPLVCGNLAFSDETKAVTEEEARRNLREVAELQNLAFEFTNSFNYPKAEVIWTQLIGKDPTIAAAWSNRGNCRTSQGKFTEAIEDFNKASELAPNEPDPYLGRGVAYEGLKRFEDAIKEYNQANEKSKAKFGQEDPVTYNNVANAYAGMGKWEDAMMGYQKAYLMQREYVFPRASEALMLFQLGRDDEAAVRMRGLVRKYPTFADMHAGLAALYYTSNQISLAEKEYGLALDQDPRYKDLEWVTTVRRWPPRATEALSKLKFERGYNF